MGKSWLHIVRGKERGRRFELSATEPTRIGRDKTNLIRLSDSEASRCHAEISVLPGGAFIRDLESSNGTYLNGQAIDRATLKNGDQIDIGQSTLIFGTRSSDTKPGTIPPSHLDLGVNASDSSVNIAPSSGSKNLVSAIHSDFQFMVHAAMAATSDGETNEKLEQILDLVFDWIEVERGCILLWDEEEQKYSTRAKRYRTAESKTIELTISQSIIDHVLNSNEGIITSNACQDSRICEKGKAGSVVMAGVKEAICVPIRGRWKIHGFIYADTIVSQNKEDNVSRLNDDHLKSMIAIGQQVGYSIENNEYYAALVESERLTAVGQALATLSHHVKNILQSINGGTHLIEDGLTNHNLEIIETGWGIVRRNQRNMSNLVMDMVSFSKPGSPHRKGWDLNRIINSAIKGAFEFSGKEDMKVDWTKNSEVEDVFVDVAQMTRAIENVLSHTIDCCDDSSTATLTIQTYISNWQGRQHVFIKIKDDFQNLSDNRIPKLFEPFAEESENEVHGIGLAVTRKILNEHDGDIVVARRSSTGIKFTIFFPLPSYESESENPTGSFRLDKTMGLEPLD